MLSGHPHIERISFRETTSPEGRPEQVLVVETRLSQKDGLEIRALEDYLANLAQHDFAGFQRFELLHGRGAGESRVA